MDNRVCLVALIVLCTTRPARADDLLNQKNVGTAIVVAGAAIDLAAIAFYASALSKRDEARDGGCHADLTHCPISVLPTAESSYRAANRATVLFVVGTAAAGVGIYVRLSAPGSRAVSISPTIGPGAAGAMLSGRF